MRPTTLRTAAALAALAVLSFPHDSASQTCGDLAARNLMVGAASDAVVNPPGQEDNQFFSSQAGFPNIFFLLDTSGSMQRLPPNGPPGDNVGTLPVTGMVGCGYDPQYGGTALLPAGQTSTVLDLVAARVYHSPCGATGKPEGQPYMGDTSLATGVDYAAAAAVCPYYTSSNTFQTGVPGFDQDFYSDSTNTSSGGGKPNFFPKTLVFHDSLLTAASGWSGDGWTFTSVNPSGTIANFCAAISNATTLQNGVKRQDICNSCLLNKGFFYDGTTPSWNSSDQGTFNIPSLWYTGNYLSFYPPKFIVARRVVKDVIANQSKIRMALGQFSSSGYSLVRDFNPSCQSIFGNGNWEQNRGTYVNDVNALDWGGGTPLASALFDVGRYYHTATLPWFGNAWENSSNGFESATSANQAAVCWSCQVSSVILVTDGAPSSNDGNSLPNQSGADRTTSPCASIADSNSGKYAGDTSTCILTPSAADCPQCYDFTGTDDDVNNLTRVAFYLHNYDLRGEAAGACGGNGGTMDGLGMPGKQTLDIYTVGFATSGVAKANRLLADTARVGGGVFYPAEGADDLKAGIFNAFVAINTRATSFSVATVSTLQTTTGHSVIVPRFNPSRAAHWEGHLSRFELYSEFVNPCTPNGPGDLDCDGLCASVFLTDANGKFIGEDGNGSFMRTDNNLPPCSQTPACVAAGKSCGTVTNTAAVPWWDAYNALKAMGWSERYVWTVVADQNGKFTLAVPNDGRMIRLAATDTVADALIPYLGLGAVGTVCSDLGDKIQTAGDPVTAGIVRTSVRDCAKAIIRWVLGADVMNEMGRTPAQGWPPPLVDGSQPASASNPPNQDLLLDRAFKLGDIYHSSPVVVDAPLPSDGILCPNGLHNQCMESLWRTPVKHLSNVNQYDLYSKSGTFQNRRKVILVGANDGLLHAFNGGKWHPNADDPVTTGVDESQPPFSGYYDRGEFDGPKELWAFLPPDLIAKIPTLLGTVHQLFVDGTAMVRDVWVDGQTGNGLSPGPALDGMKSASEFHTVAVVGERRGGNHYFALDVTNATNLTSESGDHGPKFLWVYPQPSDRESLRFGETYDDFLPVPPPIGPVRIKADANAQVYGLADDTNAQLMFTPEDSTNGVKYHELWVTMLPGGFDPNLVRGRGVHMVDVWRGTEVFDFSYPTGIVSTTDPRLNLRFPIAATPAMVMWGKAARRPSLGFENDGFFDTATFGDTGGQLWVVRFNRPATLDTNGKADNWFGGRIFTNGDWSSAWTGSLCSRDTGIPFFYITANTALPSSHVFRVYAGTGDRFNLLDLNGGQCGPDNIRACAQKGCAVTLAADDNQMSATGVGYDGEGLSQSQCGSGISAGATYFTGTSSTTGTAPVCGTRSGVHIEVSGCPDATAGTSFSKDVMARCDADANGRYGCTSTKASSAAAGPVAGANLDQAPNLSSRPLQLGMYVSIKVFEDSGSRTIFDSQSAAASYDALVMQLNPLVSGLSPISPTASSWYQYTSTGQPIVLIDGSSNNPTTLADTNSPGWAIFYNHGPSVTTNGHVYNVSQLDERTSSVTGLYGKALWNAIQPALSEATSSNTSGGCVQSKCQGAFRRVAYHYGADAVTGGPVFVDSSGNPLRAIVQNTLVPAQGDQPTVFVNQKGQIAVGLTAVNPEKGGSNLGMSGAMDPVMGLGVVEISKSLHDCRHSSSAIGATPPAASKCQ
jgi:type IV pilus assembly protein PilY1